MPTRSGARANRWLPAAAALGATTLALLSLRARLGTAHVALLLLLVVLVGSATGGYAVGVALAATGFVVFDVLFVPPYGTLWVADPRDWLVLVAFLITGLVAASLLARAQHAAERARVHAAEVDRLASLAAASLSAVNPDESLVAISRAIAGALGVSACTIHVAIDGPHGVQPGIPGGAEPDQDVLEVIRNGMTRQSTSGRPGTAAPVTMTIPLAVHGRTVGVLRLMDPAGIPRDPTRRRYLDALAHYAALGVERWRLTREAASVDALREADRVKDAMLATVSHDLRTPLTTIRGLAHDIAREGEVRALVIEEEVLRLDRFVRDLLDYSRLNMGRLPLALALNTADDLLGATLQRLEGHAGFPRISAQLDPDDPLLVGYFDLDHSVRILTNLLENALGYSPITASVTLSARRHDAWLELVVSDRGPGIPEAEQARIFSPFVRGASPEHAERGSRRSAGLGLAIGRGLAEAQGGTLHVAMNPEGGSQFILRLPGATLSAIPEE